MSIQPESSSVPQVPASDRLGRSNEARLAKIPSRSSWIARALIMAVIVGSPACGGLKGNTAYVALPDRKSEGTSPAKAPFTVKIDRIKLNDRFGNDFERSVLVKAGILKDMSSGQANGVEISAGTEALSPMLDSEIEAFFTPERQDALRAAQPAAPDGTPIGTTSDVVDKVKKLVKDTLKDELKASYALSITTSAVSFTKLARLDDDVSYDFKQASVARTYTEVEPDLLLFEGGGAEKLGVTMELKRDSLIAKSLQRGLDKLKDSHWVSDMLQGALSSVSLGVASELGKAVGARIDDAIYAEAKQRFAPTPSLFKATWQFLVTEGSTPTPDQLLSGQTLCLVNARVEGESPRDPKDTLLFEADLVVTGGGQP